MPEPSQKRRAPFECQRCGQCCRGRGGIYLSAEEAAAAAEFLGVSGGEFHRRYLEPRGRGWEVLSSAGPEGACALFGPQGCLIHPVKPRVCRRWPSFQALIKDPDAFEEAKEHCPGLDPGAGHDKFVAWAREHGPKEDP